MKSDLPLAVWLAVLCLALVCAVPAWAQTAPAPTVTPGPVAVNGRRRVSAPAPWPTPTTRCIACSASCTSRISKASYKW